MMRRFNTQSLTILETFRCGRGCLMILTVSSSTMTRRPTFSRGNISGSSTMKGWRWQKRAQWHPANSGCTVQRSWWVSTWALVSLKSLLDLLPLPLHITPSSYLCFQSQLELFSRDVYPRSFNYDMSNLKYQCGNTHLNICIVRFSPLANKCTLHIHSPAQQSSCACIIYEIRYQKEKCSDPKSIPYICHFFSTEAIFGSIFLHTKVRKSRQNRFSDKSA